MLKTLYFLDPNLIPTGCSPQQSFFFFLKNINLLSSQVSTLLATISTWVVWSSLFSVLSHTIPCYRTFLWKDMNKCLLMPKTPKAPKTLKKQFHPSWAERTQLLSLLGWNMMTWRQQKHWKAHASLNEHSGGSLELPIGALASGLPAS